MLGVGKEKYDLADVLLEKRGRVGVGDEMVWRLLDDQSVLEVWGRLREDNDPEVEKGKTLSGYFYYEGVSE